MKVIRHDGQALVFNKCGKFLRQYESSGLYPVGPVYFNDVGTKKHKKERDHNWVTCTQEEFWAGFSNSKEQKIIMKIKYGI